MRRLVFSLIGGIPAIFAAGLETWGTSSCFLEQTVKFEAAPWPIMLYIAIQRNAFSHCDHFSSLSHVGSRIYRHQYLVCNMTISGGEKQPNWMLVCVYWRSSRLHVQVCER